MPDAGNLEQVRNRCGVSFSWSGGDGAVDVTD